MIYRNFKGKPISALGMGCMRFPTKDRQNNAVDMDATREMIALAMKNGLNYFDTAWVYHGGTSETVLGELLSDYPRDTFYLATKFPGIDLSNMDKVEEIFEKQLKKCCVDYFDFYLLHNVCEMNIDAYLDPKFGILPYLLRQKEIGRIRHLGFSAHGSLATMNRFLDAVGEHMEFCQIQLNWIDWKLQNAKAKVALLNERNIPIFVMEPLRGGKLAALEEKHEAVLKTFRTEASVASWSFRFLQSIPGVVMTLSGMSNEEQLLDNLSTYAHENPLSAEETDALMRIAEEMTSKGTLPCTACRYCTPHCPMELDIPVLIERYNEYVYSHGGFLVPMAIRGLSKNKRPSACIGCRACESVCPQSIKISEMMNDFTHKLSK